MAKASKKPRLKISATNPVRSPQMTLADTKFFLAALSEAHPDAKSDLVFVDPFTLLVSVVLSAQATDASVNKATPALFALAPTPEAMVALGVEEIGRHIRTIGLWQAKARHVHALSVQLVTLHAGEVPSTRAELEALPGVGRKTANVVLNVAFGESAMAVDTHVFRVGNRTGMAPGPTVRAVEDKLTKRIPPDILGQAHHWLILHGRYVCRARLPECWRCAGRPWCRMKHKIMAPPGVKGLPDDIADV